MTPQQSDHAQAVRRSVGIAALRQLRRLVDAENAQERSQTRWAWRIGLLFLAAGGAFLTWLLGRLSP